MAVCFLYAHRRWVNPNDAAELARLKQAWQTMTEWSIAFKGQCKFEHLVSMVKSFRERWQRRLHDREEHLARSLLLPGAFDEDPSLHSRRLSECHSPEKRSRRGSLTSVATAPAEGMASSRSDAETGGSTPTPVLEDKVRPAAPWLKLHFKAHKANGQMCKWADVYRRHEKEMFLSARNFKGFEDKQVTEVAAHAAPSNPVILNLTSMHEHGKSQHHEATMQQALNHQLSGLLRSLQHEAEREREGEREVHRPTTWLPHLPQSLLRPHVMNDASSAALMSGFSLGAGSGHGMHNGAMSQPPHSHGAGNTHTCAHAHAHTHRTHTQNTPIY
jgi:hypothetical protein